MKSLKTSTHAISLIKVLVLLFVIQTIRIMTVKVFFLFYERTSLNNTIIHAIFMSLFTIIIILWAKKKGKSLSITTNIKNNKKLYIIITVIAILLIVLNPIFTETCNMDIIISIIYSVIITPIFEEILFRGCIWNYLEDYYKNEFTVYIIITILFAIWHLGYFDSIILNMRIYSLAGNLIFVMLMKTVTGLVFGIIIGFIRYKTKNTYSAILTHSIMNIFGK